MRTLLAEETRIGMLVGMTDWLGVGAGTPGVVPTEEET